MTFASFEKGQFFKETKPQQHHNLISIYNFLIVAAYAPFNERKRNRIVFTTTFATIYHIFLPLVLHTFARYIVESHLQLLFAI